MMMAVVKQMDTLQVLIVDDEKRIAEINRRFVERVEGFKVAGIATDTIQAMDFLDVLEIDLVLLDIYFPGASGLELLKIIQKQYPNTDVIMISAAKEIETVRESVKGGAFDYILKPLIFERLQDTMNKYYVFRSRLAKLQQEGRQISQDEIDHLIKGEDKRDAPYLPTGIDKLTLEKIVSVITAVKEGLTAEQVSRSIGASRSTARRYLEYLVSVGRLKADLSYGTVGRPERVYKGTGVK
jgi:two-component system, CitB family, response regulator